MNRFTIAVVGIRDVGLYVIYTDAEDWPLITACSSSFWLVPNSEADGTAFVEQARKIAP